MDIKLLNDQKRYEALTGHRRQFDKLDIGQIKQTLGGKTLLGYQVGEEDQHFLAKQLALVKQAINIGQLRKAIKMLTELETHKHQHADVYYMLGECHRRLGIHR